MLPTTTCPVCSPMPISMGTLADATRSSFHSRSRFCIFTAARTAWVASSGRRSGARCLGGIVGPPQRRSPQAHERVADELVEDAVVLEEDVHHQLEVVVEH